MSKFLFLWLQAVMVLMVAIHVDTVSNKKKDFNKPIMPKSNQFTNSFASDLRSLFENSQRVKKRHLSKTDKLMANKTRIQQLLKVKSFLDSIERHVRSARLRHYSEVIHSRTKDSLKHRTKKSAAGAKSNHQEKSSSSRSPSTPSTLSPSTEVSSTTTPSTSLATTTNFLTLITYQPQLVAVNGQYLNPHLDNAAAFQENQSNLQMLQQLASLGSKQGPINAQIPLDALVPRYVLNVPNFVSMPLQNSPANPNLNPNLNSNLNLNLSPNPRSVFNAENADFATSAVAYNQNLRPQLPQQPMAKPAEVSGNSDEYSKRTSGENSNEVNYNSYNNNNNNGQEAVVAENAPSSNFTRRSDTNCGGDDDDNTKKREEVMMEHILQDLEELKTGKAGMMREDLPCDVSGNWFSEAGGLMLKICAENQTNVRVSTYDPTPKTDCGFMVKTKYQFDGIIPFPQSGMILINGIAEESKHVATFIGQCLVCNGAENIAGHWLVTRKSRNCVDIKASQEIIGDVMIREKLQEAQKARLDAHGE